MDSFETHLARWQAAGLVDDAAAGRIREFERRGRRPEGHRWQVIVALTLGAVLLGAGILLFVAAHWDRVSPLSRFAFVIGALALLHLGGILLRERFAGLATALHALGTIALGGAIAMIGQIFNMQSHWPTAVLLWALGAVAGWWLLADGIQQVFAMLLLPAWVVCEFTERTSVYDGADIYLARIVMVLAALYVTAFAKRESSYVRGWLFAAGALAMPVTTAILSDGWRTAWSFRGWGFLPLSWRLAAAVLISAAVAVAWFLKRSSATIVLWAAALAYLLPWLARPGHQSDFGMNYVSWGPSVLTFAVLAMSAAALAWWAVQQSAKAVVNYAMLAFAAVVLWFYFSSVLDKMNRSLGLIGLGVVFLLGGYGLERIRRNLLRQMAGAEAA